MVRLAVLLDDPPAAQLMLQAIAAAAAAAGKPGRVDQPVEFLTDVKYFSWWS
jgi:hypothetical protein